MHPLRIGALGLGSVFWGPYASLIGRLQEEGLAELACGYDVDAGKVEATVRRFGPGTGASSTAELLRRDDVDVVLVLTSMNEHGSLAQQALEAGKHVLVEKPMATDLAQARRLLEVAADAPGTLLCAPHVLLSPTYREMHRRVRAGRIGDLVLGRARYGWAGPWWGRWFYKTGGGALFDLGVYNLTSLAGFFGPVRRVTAMVGTAIPRREAEGQVVDVTADDNAHVVMDFGDARFASFMTGFTMQKYRSPAVELYGTTGTLQLLGDDWAPEGFEHWTNERGSWEVVPETDPDWPWTAGLRHLVECVRQGRPTVTRPEHAFHALEVCLAAQESARTGRVVEVTSDFPEPDWTSLPDATDDLRRRHDPRTT